MFQCHKGHEVSALVFRFLHKGPDPAAIVDHQAQAFQVKQGRGNHRGDRRHCLKHDDAMPIAPAQKSASAGVDQLRHTKGKAIRP